jgi:hypothetical protein
MFWIGFVTIAILAISIVTAGLVKTRRIDLGVVSDRWIQQHRVDL